MRRRIKNTSIIGRSLLAISILLLICNKGNAQVVFGKKDNSGLSINYSSPKEYEIADIRVEGIEFLDNNALISLSGLRVGDKIKIPGDEISTSLKKLWKQGIIGNIAILGEKVEGDKIWLVIKLTERPRLTRYNISGVSKTMKGEIEDKIDLVRGRVLTDVLVKNTELSIRKFLEGKGFLNAKIDIFQRTDTVVRNSAVLDVNIAKGRKVKIRNIHIYGDTDFKPSRLRKKLKKTGMMVKFSLPSTILNSLGKIIWPPKIIEVIKSKKDTIESPKMVSDMLAKHVNLNFFKSAKFVKNEYETDKETLITFLNSKGYRDAEIILDTTYIVDNKYMNVDITLNQGARYYFRDIEFTGNYIYTSEQLSNVLGVEKGDVYDLELINKKLNFNPNGVDISSLYMDDGYLFFNINPVEVRAENDSIDLELRVYEGAQATINKVIISGNDKTNDHVILRQLRTLPGEKFSRSELIRTQRELSTLGYFDPEQINPVPVPDPVNETVDIEWNLVERSNDQIQLSGGWGGAFGFVGTFGVTFNNFSTKNIFKPENWRGLPVGDGQSLGIQFQANGRQFQSYSFSFSEPWLGGRKPNSLGISYSKSIQRIINRVSDNTLGWLKVTGVSLSFGRMLKRPDDFFTMSNGIAFQQYDLNEFTTRSLGFNTGIANSFTFNTTFARNSMDQPIYPRRGSSVSLSASFTPPYSLFNNIDYENADNEELYNWLEYHKWNFDSRHVQTLVGKLVIMSRAHFGYLGSYRSDVGVGPFERFQLGGDGLTGQNFILGTDVIGLRGYPNNSLVPRDTGGDSDASNDIDGGTIFNKYVFEVRYPISLAPTATIYALTFVEGGNNWNNFAEFNPLNIKKAAGVGLRINMPAFGLMGIDWAYGFDTYDGVIGNSGPQFHFSIGQQIR